MTTMRSQIANSSSSSVELHRADIDAARELIDEDEIGIARQLPRDDELLLVAA